MRAARRLLMLALSALLLAACGLSTVTTPTPTPTSTATPTPTSLPLLYGITDLGATAGSGPAGPFRSGICGLNNYGQVLLNGYSNPRAAPQTLLWTPTTPNGTTGSTINTGLVYCGGANDMGQVAGADGAGGLGTALWTPHTPNGTTGTIANLGITAGIAVAINQSGQIAGTLNIDGHGGGPPRIFLWTPNAPNGTTGSLQDLGAFPGDASASATGIDNFGQVIGDSLTAGGQSHAVLWTKPTASSGGIGMVGLGNVADDNHTTGINSAGKVVGKSNNRVFIWTPTSPNTYSGAPSYPGTLPGDTSGVALGINDAGQVVGITYVTSTSPHPFLWDSAHGFRNVNSLLAGGVTATALEAQFINNLGQIAGTATIGGAPHNVLLTPM